jgi:hypothetical protein
LFESEFERQAHVRGYHVVGIKAPIMTGPYRGYRLPDFSVLANGRCYWNEVKYKTTATLHRKTDVLEHGIDLPNWNDYLAICKLSGLPGYLTIGEGHTGRILTASFEFLARHGRVYDGCEHFTQGAIFWAAAIFREWGHFDLRTGQMHFDFGAGERLA